VRSYKTEINPTQEQITKIRQTLGVCRFVYNFYIAHNKKIYQEEKRFVSGYEFSKWLNNEFVPNNPDYKWIKDVSSKAVKQSIMNGEKAFKSFFKGLSGYPKFKKKKNQNVKAYFPKNNKTDWVVERHRIKIPTFGFIRLKEKGYIPTNIKIISGTISIKAGRYYVTVLVEEEIKNNLIYANNNNQGIGIDLGIKEFAVCSNLDNTFENINKTSKVKKLEKKLKREQRSLSRKYNNLKKKGGKSATKKNISKQVLKVQNIHHQLTNIREDYINKVISELVKIKPSFITIEDLNVSGMMKNRHLARSITQQCFNQFKIKLTNKCHMYGIELRIVDKFYPSSKLCSCCGHIKKDLNLSDREYICLECGLKIDRDKNASINLANTKVYKVI